MVVSFTPNIGLAKPDKIDVAKDWVTGAAYQAANNTAFINSSAIPMTPYTPVFGSDGTQPSFGAGSIVGEYQEFQGWIFGSFVIVFVDPGVSVGTGELNVRLPVPADATFHTIGAASSLTGANSVIGEGYVRDDSSIANCGTLALDLVSVSGNHVVRFVTEAIAGKTSRVLSATSPFSLANFDSLSGSFFYKKA